MLNIYIVKLANTRRFILLTFILFSCSILFQQTVLASWDKKPFESKTVDGALKFLYGSSQLIESDMIHIKVPDIAENGSVVPVTITAKLENIESVSLLVDGNPYPLVSHQAFKGGKHTQIGYRVKMQKKSYVIAVVKAGGKLYTTKKYIKVTKGGCGGGGGDSGSVVGGYGQRNAPYANVTNHNSHALSFSNQVIRNEKYQSFKASTVVSTLDERTSTFSIDVDTGGYSNVRRFVYLGQQPPKDAVRIEEMINYFSYDYPSPESTATPFNTVTEVSTTPWNKDTHLLHIGIKGYEVPLSEIPPMNLVFLIDVSGSMNAANKLGLLKTSIKLLAKRLRVKDVVSIVVYAGAAGVVLPPTPGNHKEHIISSLDKLSAGGSTNGGHGIQLAYSLAKKSFIKGGVNRVILGTDGDFNVGVTSTNNLIKLVDKNRQSGVYLSTLGFGMGNYNDELMERLADKGNGNYAYIDNIQEAQKVLVKDMASTLNTIAKDVKIQMEFNPAVVAEYRLVGYENRTLENKDFKNDKVDAGEIGAGHTVTALYEITLAESPYRALEPQRYGAKLAGKTINEEELGVLRIRYKNPEEEKSLLQKWTIQKSDIIENLSNTSNSFRFSASVAALGQKMRKSDYVDEVTLDDIVDLASSARGEDMQGYRNEFIRMVNLYGSSLN